MQTLVSMLVMGTRRGTRIMYTCLFITPSTSYLVTGGVPYNFVVPEIHEKPTTDIVDTMESPHVALLDISTFAFTLGE